MNKSEDDFDWFHRAGISPSDYDALVAAAKKKGIPTFPDDTAETIYNRCLAFEVHQNNKSTLLINKILAFISFASAVVAVITLFIK
tara:strand:- start:13423 stop:13680 length:258 start_codon:yes stop_codon:yes gene_type:complete